MACEVPVIATNVGRLPEVVEHGVDGYLWKPQDVAAAAKYAIDLLSRADAAAKWVSWPGSTQEKFSPTM